MDLAVDYLEAQDSGDMRHAQQIMHDFGITYQYCVPIGFLDSFWFYDCSNVPPCLPSYVKVVDGIPRVRLIFEEMYCN